MRCSAYLYAVLAGCLIMSAAPAFAAVDCAKIMAVKKKDNFKADPNDVQTCVLRGWDAPKQWKRDEGKSVNIKASGGGGFSYGTIQAPEASPGARKVKASVSSDVIRSSCSFPPRITLGLPPKIDFPKGSCWDFFNNLLRGRNGNTNNGAPTPPGIPANTACPAESDKIGLFGTKTTLTAGSTPRSCGGSIPLTSTDMVLNRNSDALASTENGQYYIWIYQKTGNGYALVKSGSLPTYLCSKTTTGDGETMQKSIDLTPPVSQMITYTAGQPINIRLQSRETMDANFIPPYNEDEPERYLLLKLGDDGQIKIPENCADEAESLSLLSTRQDILVQSSTSGGCEPVSVTPTSINNPTVAPPPGGTLGEDGKCRDAGGVIVPCVITNNWTQKCPNGSDPVGGKCPHQEGVPNEAACAGGTTGAQANANCDTLKITLRGGTCDGKIQYNVLNRPNLYYPAGATTTTHPIGGRTALMAETVDGSQMMAQSQTSFFLQPTAPALVFNEGGYIKLANGGTLIMKPPATVDASAGTAKLTGGGELTSSGGTQLQSFAAGANYPISSSISAPLHIKVGRTVDIPKGFSIPTLPTIDGQTPYIRLPIDAPPK
jgi:hypothetical protein